MADFPEIERSVTLHHTAYEYIIRYLDKIVEEEQ
jgi:hypothetical protein